MGEQSPCHLGSSSGAFLAAMMPTTARGEIVMGVYSKEELLELFKQVGLPFDEVESGSDGVIAVVFATDDKDYQGD